MNANLQKKTIEMSATEAKAAGKINSDKFNELQEYRNAYPTFAIVIKAPSKRKAEFSGLDYKYMTNYIKKCKREDKADIMAEFNTLIALDKKNKVEGSEHLEAAGYLDVKKWFLAKFPEIKEYKETHSKKVQAILNAAA